MDQVQEKEKVRRIIETRGLVFSIPGRDGGRITVTREDGQGRGWTPEDLDQLAFVYLEEILSKSRGFRPSQRLASQWCPCDGPGCLNALRLYKHEIEGERERFCSTQCYRRSFTDGDIMDLVCRLADIAANPDGSKDLGWLTQRINWAPGRTGEALKTIYGSQFGTAAKLVDGFLATEPGKKLAQLKERMDITRPPPVSRFSTGLNFTPILGRPFALGA